MPAAHEKADAEALAARLRRLFDERRAAGAAGAACRRLVEEASPPPPGWKRVSFIRHGEGHHNVAQREWKEAGKPGEPYTLDTDPEFGYLDPELTPLGREQAVELRARARQLADVEVIVVSPMRRAMQTALLGFERAVDGGTPVVAQELCHELAGKHTCDKRLSVAKLAAEFPQVDYELLESEEDPYWGDGLTRETHEAIAERGARFAKWLLARPEQRLVVAAHSAWLMTLFNAVLDVRGPAGEVGGGDELRTWFGTGEMRTVLLGPFSAEAAAPGAKRAASESSDGGALRKRPAANTQ